MDIHEFISQAINMDANCLATFDLFKSLEEKKEELETESLRKQALNSDLILCYN